MALDRFLYWREQRPTISELKRIIEDYLGRKGIDVITRQADEYTNVVAKGLWELLRRYYAAKTEDEECEPEKPESIVEGLKTTRLIERLREAAQHAEYPQGDPPVCHEADEFIRRLRE